MTPLVNLASSRLVSRPFFPKPRIEYLPPPRMGVDHWHVLQQTSRQAPIASLIPHPKQQAVGCSHEQISVHAHSYSLTPSISLTPGPRSCPSITRSPLALIDASRYRVPSASLVSRSTTLLLVISSYPLSIQCRSPRCLPAARSRHIVGAHSTSE